MAIGTDDTEPPAPKRSGPQRRRDDGAAPVGFTVDECGRALGFVERKIDVLTAILTGDPNDPRDLGLRGDSQRQAGELQRVALKVDALKPMPKWVQWALVVAAIAVGLRALDGTGRDRGWWSTDQHEAAQAVRR